MLGSSDIEKKIGVICVLDQLIGVLGLSFTSLMSKALRSSDLERKMGEIFALGREIGVLYFHFSLFQVEHYILVIMKGR